MEILYAIHFYSDWHCSSGLTSGTDADSLAIRDQDSLPYIPGKTIKGLLREAASIFAEFSEDQEEWKQFLQKCFGKQSDKENNQSQEGICYFSNAELSKAVKVKLLENQKSPLRLIFRKIASTAIEDDGQAKEHSLRKMEVTVPLVLFGQIQDCPDEYKDKMRSCLQWVKRLGVNRNRGLGRCDIKEVI
ncbi:MAG: CRISPR-associated protein [Candidatus Brocadiae bacterium]|nr:CRISPR-associated protein [Candidatus Brocadiia bacterium]